MVFTFVLMAAATVRGESAAVSDTEVWNEGVGYYQQGDVTNALRVLRPLTASGEYKARAAEVVAKLEYERGNLEEAAAAAQVALLANPKDARSNRNFTRAVDKLPEVRETKRINEILKAAEGKDPGAMIQSATYEARELMKSAAGVSTNRADVQVALADRLSKRAEKLADVWIPVREVIAQSVTNEQQAATIIQQIEEAQAKTKKGAQQLSDLDSESYSSLALAEQDFNRFLKLTAMPPAAIHEGALAQSNAYNDVETVNSRPWQNEALDFTRAFRQKFPAWARQYEQQAQADTNREPFTAEAQAKISALATELEKVQLECVEKTIPPKQEEACGILEQIAALLPKDKNGGGQSQQNQQQNPQQNQQNQDQQNQDQQNQDQKDQQQDLGDQKQDQDPNEQKDDKQEEGSDAEDQESEEDKEVEAVLQKAQERNDEYEADKKARIRKAPLPPNERDW